MAKFKFTQSFKCSGAHQLVFDVCEFSKFCFAKENTEEIDATEILLNKSNIHSHNYEGRQNC